jgi:hypothetical protein
MMQKNAALREKSLVEEINSLKSQLTAKEKERIETVEALHNMESRCISIGAKLETKTEDYDNLKKDLEKVVREKNYLEKKSLEKDQNFHNKCNHLWELCKNCYDKFDAKPEDPCWELREFDPFFAWLCRQYEDLPTVLQTSADLSCMYSSHAIFHLMKEANDPLYEKLYDQSYRFPLVESLNQVSSRTQTLCKKYFHEYWNQGGGEHAFMKAKQKMEKVCYLYVILIHCFFLVFFLIYCFILLCCSSLKRDLLLMRRQKRGKKDLNKRGRGMMMLKIMYFSLS